MNLKDCLLDLKERILSKKEKEDIKYVSCPTPNSAIVEKVLEQATMDFFPKNCRWNACCFKKSQELQMQNLPCHLRDDEWLASMLKKNLDFTVYSYEQILNFVKQSQFFAEERHKYELEIVKWQINWMKNGGENWICSNEFGGEFGSLTSKCDLWFRKGIVDTLNAIGMDLQVIEEGIEKFSDLWRENYMKLAFKNEYEPVFYNILDKEKLQPADSEHKEKWLKMRRYEYYQNHKYSVDKYGVVSSDMLMTREEIEQLKEELNTMNKERLEALQLSRGKQKVISK